MIKWIPLHEALPPIHFNESGELISEEVILLIDDEEWLDITNGYLNVGAKVFERNTEAGVDYVASLGEVKAWIPIPELPEEEP